MSETQTTEQETHLPFEAMILASIKEKKEVYDNDNDERVRQAVTVEMRHRKNYFGVFNTKANRRLEYVGGLGKGLVTYPVVPRAIRSKSATSLATDVKIDVKPSRQIPEIEAGADIAQNIVKRVDTNVWDEDFEINSAHLRMTQRLCYYRIFNNQSKGIRYQEQVQSDEFEQLDIHGTIFGCSDCGEEIEEKDLPPAPTEIGRDGYDNAPAAAAPPPSCPMCGKGVLTVIKDALSEQIQPFKTVTKRTGEPDAELISTLLTRVDDLSGVGLQFESVKWFNVNKLVPLLQLQRQFPVLKKDLGSSNYEKWSAGTHWWYALTKEQGNFHYSKSVGESYKTGIKSYHELEKWFFTPEQCEGWESPGEWKLFASHKDAPDFDFLPGETIADAVIRNERNKLTGLAMTMGTPENPDDIEFMGACVWIANGKVLKIENASFHDDYGVIGWMINPTSYFPQGEEGLLGLQDAATNTLSMVYSGGLKRKLAPLVINDEFFDEDDVTRNQTGGVIVAKKDSGRDLAGVNLRNHLFYPETPPIDSFIWQLAELIINIQKEESGVYDETVGQVNSQNQTMGGRLQAVNQSLSLMLSPSKAKKRGKIQLIKKVLKKWQSLPDEAFKIIKGSFNEEWKADDIASFKNLDVENDLIYNVVEGSDVPKATPDTQTQLMQVYQMGLLDPNNTMPTDFILKLLRALGVEYDVKNSDASRRLAAKRLKLLKEKIADVNPADAFAVVEEPQPDGTVIERKVLDPQLLMDVMSDVRLQAHETENHQVMMEFFADQINGELGRDMPNEVLLYYLDEMVRQHLSTMNGVMKKEAATQGDIEGTNRAVAEESHRALTGADEKEAAMMDAQNADAERKFLVDGENKRVELEEKDKQRRHDLQKTLIQTHNKPNGKK